MTDRGRPPSKTPKSEGITHEIGSGFDRMNPDEFAGRKRVPAPKNNGTIDKWRRWLDRIRDDLHDIHGNQAAFNEINSMLTNPAIPGSAIIDYIAGNYARSQAVAVRRQTDVGGRSITLGRLLTELKATDLITREWVVGQFPWGMQGFGDRQFDAWAYLDPEHPAADEPGDALSPGVVERDIQRLAHTANPIRRYVDTHLAHADAKPTKDIPTFADLADAINVVGDVFNRYHTLLTGTSILQLAPVPQYDWLAPFRVPWLTD